MLCTDSLYELQISFQSLAAHAVIEDRFVIDTVNVQEDEWLSVGNWVYEHFDEMAGVSFLPAVNHTYQQAPYQDCDGEKYDVVLSSLPNIPWHKLSDYEKADYTTASQELACVGNSCEVV